MKKITAITLVCLLLLGLTSTAFAADLTGRNGQVAQQNKLVSQEKRGEIEQLREEIRSNRAQISDLHQQIKDSAQDLRQEIKAKLEDRANLDAGDVKKLREAVQTLRKERLDLANEHVGKILEQLNVLYQARLSRDWDRAIGALNKIAAEQESRLQDMHKMLSDIQALAHNL